MTTIALHIDSRERTARCGDCRIEWTIRGWTFVCFVPMKEAQ